MSERTIETDQPDNGQAHEENATTSAIAPDQTTEGSIEAVEAPPVEIEIPARLLHVVGVAAKEDGKYQMSGVMIETRDTEGLVSAAATDGRRLMVAECNRSLFDGQASIYIPRKHARNAAKISIARPQDDKSDAVVTLRRERDKCIMTAYTTEGPVTFGWDVDPDSVFPPYRDVIPDWSESTGVGRIGITPELVASALKTLQKVVGKDPKVKVYLPPTPDRALGLESQDGDKVKALVVVMPADIEGWMPEQAIKAVAKVDAPTEQMDLPKTSAEDAVWRSVRLDSLTPAIKQGKLKSLLEHDPSIVTMGDLVDYQGSAGEWWAKNVKGLGEGGVEQIIAATTRYWEENPQTNPVAQAMKGGIPSDFDSVTVSGGGMIPVAVAQETDPSNQVEQALASGPEIIPLTDNASIAVEPNGDGWCYAYSATIGKNTTETGSIKVSGFPSRRDAVQAAASEILAWAEEAKGLRGDQPAQRRALIMVCKGKLPLELATA